jgi:diaminopimelate decarboxylase
MSAMTNHPQPSPAPLFHDTSEWWERSDRHYDKDGQLWIGGRLATDLASEFGTPAYVYCAQRVSQNVARLRAAIAGIGTRARLLYAMKSNRHGPLLRHLHGLGLGLDVTSPGEVRHALACGFTLDQLSFTAGCLSHADYAALAEWTGMWVNADSLTALRSLAAYSPGRRLGLRINPAASLGYNELVNYSGPKASKFGVYLDRFSEALTLARALGLDLAGLHCHAGCGFLTPQLDDVDRVYTRIGEFLDVAPEIRQLNLGGGLGIPLVAGDAELDLGAWAELARRHFAHRHLELVFEPGDYLVKDAGTLLTEITQVEVKGSREFVGVNAGFNVHPEPAFYRLPLIPAPAVLLPGDERCVTIAGNINEALDLWAEDILLPPVQEGAVLCFLNAGGYGASMASRHCLRDEMTENLIDGAEVFGDGDLEALADSNKHAWDELYASTSELVWGTDPLPFLAEFVDEFRGVLTTPSRVLDAGAGEGRNLPFLLDCHASEVHALDASAHALDKIPALLKAQIKCRAADLSATGYAAASFDGITLLDVFETLPNVDAALAELYHILKPGGLLLCNIPGFDDGVAGHDMDALDDHSFLYRKAYFYRFIEPEAAHAMLLTAGFEILQSGRREWIEASHPGFRSGDHTHVSHVLLVRRPLMRKS